MGVSITVSGSVFWEVYVDVPLNKNFGISTFGISASPTSFTDLFTWLKFLLMTPKAFESKLQRGHMVVPLILQQCIPGISWVSLREAQTELFGQWAHQSH